MDLDPRSRAGATYLGNGHCQFVLWAPHAQRVELHLLAPPSPEVMPLLPAERGYFHATVEGVEPGRRYFYRLNDGAKRPDPASRLQPEGVHGPSQVVSSEFEWTDGDWRGLPLTEHIFYEIHVGTFTHRGDLGAIVPHLDDLKELGVTSLELMPLAQFPGTRNWGYDGVFPFAVQDSYGGPEELKRLVDACHQRGLSLTLDVVYNHLGPEGNYFREFGPYFTDRYRTPWGPAINFDGAYSDEVRRYFIENALYWISDCHVDALRLDAVHAIADPSPRTFLEELASEIHRYGSQTGRLVYLIPESAANDPRLLHPPERGGYGLDAQWNDDFHHALRTLVTDDRSGYYQDYGQVAHLTKAFREGFVYSGEYSPYRLHRHGASSRDIPAHRFVVFSQNHDQVGNRMLGERLSELVGFERLKLAAGCVLLSPFLPLLFMGEEYGETSRFPYFVSHSDPELIDAVRRGRREEFAAFGWKGDAPDPQSEETFFSARLQHELRNRGPHRTLLELYRYLIRLRTTLPSLTALDKECYSVTDQEDVRAIVLRRRKGNDSVAVIFHFSENACSLKMALPAGDWKRILDSADESWQGPGTRIPEQTRSDGEVELALAPWSIVALHALRKEASS